MGERCDLAGIPDDRHGVIPIYKPAGQARARIFAYAGPGGSWRNTWTWSAPAPPANERKDAPDGSPVKASASVLWLADLLPEQFPHCAIYSISDYFMNDEWFAVPEKRSLSIRAHLRSTPLEERAPIVFVVHGFGGIVLKQIIQQLWGSGGVLKSCTPQLDQLIGVAFLDTPHQFVHGLGTYRDFFPGYPPNAGVVKYVERLENELFHREQNAITTEFRGFVKTTRIRIFSVSEQFPSPLLQGNTTVLGGDLPSSIETTAEWPTEHFSLPKFRAQDDDRFKDVCAWLKNVFEKGPLHNLLFKEKTWSGKMFPLRPQRPFDLLFNYESDGFNGRYNWRYVPTRPISGLEDCWVHIPHNTEPSMIRAMRTMAPLPTTDIAESLGTALHARSDTPHSRSILPNSEYHRRPYKSYASERGHVEEYNGTCSILPKVKPELDRISGDRYDGEVTLVRIFVPYIHWETATAAEQYSVALQAGESSNTPAGIPVFDFAEDFKKYHPRRTLDQFYYTRMRDTTRRDNDQVVYRQTNVSDGKTEGADSSPGGTKIIMVDQLWLCLWVVHREKEVNTDREPQEYVSSGVLTSFPYTAYERPSTAIADGSEGSDKKASQPADIKKADLEAKELQGSTDVRRMVLKELEGESAEVENEGNGGATWKEKNHRQAIELVSSILSKTLLGPSVIREKHWTLDFLELFREAIGNVADEYDNFYRAFRASLEPGSDRIGVEQRKAQIGLGIEIADIIDELNMLKQLFDTQIDVLEKGIRDVAISRHLIPLQDELIRIKTAITRKYSSQIDRMAQDAERLQRSLLDLLDLQQKEENLQQALFAAKQALSAQDQADATDAQSKILFVFTVVTIVFLPLSFFTGYFGMYTISDPTTYSRSYVNKAMWGASGGLYGLALLVAAALFHFGKRSSRNDRADELNRLKDQGNLPPGLIDEKSDEHRRMETRRNKLHEKAQREQEARFAARRDRDLAETVERPRRRQFMQGEDAV